MTLTNRRLIQIRVAYQFEGHQYLYGRQNRMIAYFNSAKAIIQKQCIEANESGYTELNLG